MARIEALSSITPLPLGGEGAGWAPADAERLYRLDAWGDGLFHVGDNGHLVLRPDPQGPLIDVHAVVDDLRRRGITLPALIRFQDVLRARVRRVHGAFATAIDESGYTGGHRLVYPIKVNQLHEVLEEVLDAGRAFGIGLECGSRAELVAALPHLGDDDQPLICNGVKDAAMLRLVLAAQRLGRNVLPVVEKFSEFEALLAIADDSGTRPRLGVRLRLGTSGAGRWAQSCGDLSKFGISLPELLAVVERLRAEGRLGAFELLHFHLGSQLEDVQVLKLAVRELAQVYVQLVARGVPVKAIDIGGGLGVDYGAGHHGAATGINYTLQEYANAVVYSVRDVCDEAHAPHPLIVTESGRALTAHHSVLVVEVLGTYGRDRLGRAPVTGPGTEAPVRELAAIDAQLRDGSLSDGDLAEAWHDACEQREQAESRFALGLLPLEDKALAEQIYWAICERLQARWRALGERAPSDALQALDEQLVDHYLCDFSVFQSMLDHWAIGQGFPIVPTSRLDEPPTRRGVLVDLTCDSDGKVSHYVSAHDDRRFLPLHPLAEDERYTLAICLMGAYQDIMGDSHNLFGRVPEAHVYADAGEPGGYYIEQILPGTRVQEMLAQVQYFPNDLQRRMSEAIREKVTSGRIRPSEGAALLEQYLDCLHQPTYVVR